MTELLTVGPGSKMKDRRQLIPPMQILCLHPRLIRCSWQQSTYHIPHLLHSNTGIWGGYVLLRIEHSCTWYHNTIPLIPVTDDGGPISSCILMARAMMTWLLAVEKTIFSDCSMAIHRPWNVVVVLVWAYRRRVEDCNTSRTSKGE